MVLQGRLRQKEATDQLLVELVWPARFPSSPFDADIVISAAGVTIACNESLLASEGGRKEMAPLYRYSVGRQGGHCSG